MLVLHFVDGMKQSDIALAMNLSPSKVNRLIAQGRKLGMVKIAIESPFQRLVDLEKRLTEAGGLSAQCRGADGPRQSRHDAAAGRARGRQPCCWRHCATATSSPSPAARR